MNIDRRKHYILVVDTETVNTCRDETGRLDTSAPLCYDIGFAVVDTHGEVYATESFVNEDIFFVERDMMKTAYYAHKMPQYDEDLKNGLRKLGTTLAIRNRMWSLIEEYNIQEVVAHNARFDITALNMTLRYRTKSEKRRWFPPYIEVWDSMLMARSVIGKMPTYRKFCEENGFLTKNNQCSMNAENLYKFITKNLEFEEAHTGLEDVLIEKEIMAYCYRQHKPMKQVLYTAFVGDELTEIQKRIWKMIKNRG